MGMTSLVAHTSTRAAVEVSGVAREVTGTCGRMFLEMVSVWMFSLRVEVQAAGGRMQTMTSHISVTVSRDGSRSDSLLFSVQSWSPSCCS